MLGAIDEWERDPETAEFKRRFRTRKSRRIALRTYAREGKWPKEQ